MPTSRLFLALLVAVGPLGIHSDALAAVLCKKKSGVIAVRDTCKAKETRLDPDALGLRGSQGTKGDSGQQGTAGSPGTPGATGPQGPGFVVEDANGTSVGLVMSTDCSGTCAAIVSRHFTEGVVATFRVNTGGVDISSGTVLFDSTDCSGTPLLDSASDVLPRLVASDLFVSDTLSLTAYYPTYPGSAHQIHSKLQFGYQASCVGGVFTPPDRCCLAADEPHTAAAAGTLDWTSVFSLVPPFHVEGP